MSDGPKFPKAQKANLLRVLKDELATAHDEDGLTYSTAFREVALTWIGYVDDERPTPLDGANDRGIDAYRISRNDIDLFQFKSQDFTKKTELSTAADAKLLSDIPRIISFLQAKDYSKETKNRRVKAFVGQLQTAIQSCAPDETIVVHIRLVGLYDGLTAEAKNELKLAREQFEIINVFGREAIVEIEYIDIDALLALKWRETNSVWVDTTGQSSDWLTFHYSKTTPAFMADRTSIICYVRARDLIDAYRRFGYQIFESNVRCEITKSQVNDAIRGQVATEKGIDEFRILNNGITIICTNKKQPSNGRLELMRPQVVNGLQTITSLFDAYNAHGASLLQGRLSQLV